MVATWLLLPTSSYYLYGLHPFYIYIYYIYIFRNVKRKKPSFQDPHGATALPMLQKLYSVPWCRKARCQCAATESSTLPLSYLSQCSLPWLALVWLSLYLMLEPRHPGAIRCLFDSMPQAHWKHFFVSQLGVPESPTPDQVGASASLHNMVSRSLIIVIGS